MGISIAVIVGGVFILGGIIFLMNNSAKPEVKTDDSDKADDTVNEFQSLHLLELGKEITGFDSLLYDGLEQESYVKSYSRRIGGRVVELVFKSARDLDQLPLILNEKDVARVRARIRGQRENSLHFHVSHGCLALVFGEEINNGRWFCEIVAAWELPDLVDLLEKFLSRDSGKLRDATFDILYCPNDEILKSLVTDTEKLSEAVNKTEATGMIRDNRDYSKRAIASIQAIEQGGCRCQLYSSDPLCSVRPLEKHGLITIESSVLDKENYCMRMEVSCNFCEKTYKVVEQPGGHVEHYSWVKS